MTGWETRKWNGTLRPETLFGTKFEGYLNETPNNEKDYDIPEFGRPDRQL
ncbi:MAG: conserved phage C-terminal domain-containing protein [Dialister invisus]